MASNHKREDVIGAGWEFMDIPAQDRMFSLSAMQRLHIHSFFRLTDGLWYAVRTTDPTKAAELDAALDGPML